jgi:glycosyltransferase involved in cell wall biosynthesis
LKKKLIKFLISSSDFLLKTFGFNLKSFFYILYLEKKTFLSSHNIFDKIYKNKYWLKLESLSGSGSDLKSTIHYRNQLNNFFIQKNIKSLCDIPCGDMTWISRFLKNKKIKYLGGDVVDKIISENKKKYPSYEFKKIDLRQKILKQKFDILHIKDLLIHLSYDDIIKTFNTISQYNFKYLLISSHKILFGKNYNITTGDFRILDLNRFPFFFSKSLSRIKDYNFGEFPKYSLVYKKKDFINIIKKINQPVVVLISNGGGGIATYQSNLIKFYIQKKYKIILIDKNFKNHTYKNLNNREKNNLYFFKSNVIWEPLKTFKAIRKIDNDHTNISYIINNPTIYSIYSLFIKIFLKKNDIYLILHSHIFENNISQAISSFLCSILSIFSKKVIFVSNFTKGWWQTKFPLIKLSKSRVQYNLVKISNVKRVKSNKFRIGFVGRLSKEKGIKYFMQIVEAMKNNKDFLFLIYGDGEDKHLIKNQRNVIFKGWDIKKKFLKSIDLLLVTSPIENCPYSVLECKSNGIPTINLAKGGIQEIIKNNIDGINLAPNSNFKKIQEKIIYIKKNRIKFKKNCLKNAKKFDLSNLNLIDNRFN